MDASRLLRPWVLFGGFVLIAAVLYWAQTILVPLSIAILMTFLLTPLVARIERWVGRAVAISAVTVLTFTLLGVGAYVVGRQLNALADALPAHRDNMREKIRDIRGASEENPVEKLQQTIEEIQSEVEAADRPRGTPRQPVVVESQQVTTLWGFPAWVSPYIEPLSTAGLVVALVIFMLIEREDLRDRFISVIGHGHVSATTKALDEAASRVSRFLLMQSIVNAMYGVGVAVGLSFLGVPYALLWAALAAVLRFIPYVGPLIGAGAPILISLATFPGWTQPLYVVGLFIALELFTNMVLETVLYAGAAGVSQVGLLAAVAFWTWLWGPMGLLLATPLTVCLVVIGKHTPGLTFLVTLMADAPALAPHVRYYQRLLARDQGEAADIIEEYVKSDASDSPFDAILLPSLNYVERDRLQGHLSADDEAAVLQLTGDLIGDAAESVDTAAPAAKGTDGTASLLPVLACGANSDADVLALRMFEQVIRDLPVRLEFASARMLASEVVRAVQDRGYRVVCIADLPPSAPSKARYLIRKLRAAVPDVKILVGRWAPPELADPDVTLLREAGADFVGSTLAETHRHLHELAARGAAVPSPASAA